MKRIGLLGGMSWESTSEYYRVINRTVADRLGGLHSARMTVASVDFAEIAALQTEGRWDEAGDRLAAEARSLQAGGADLILICANTMHIVADAVQEAVDVPLLNIIDVVAEALARDNVTRVDLLGTRFTMEQPFYRERLAGAGLDVLVPAPAERAELHGIIYDELCRGVVSDASRRRGEQIVQGLADAGAEGVILGCTELELLLDPAGAAVPLYPTVRLHALAAVDAALADDAPPDQAPPDQARRG